jgi:hypothetical protein
MAAFDESVIVPAIDPLAVAWPYAAGTIDGTKGAANKPAPRAILRQEDPRAAICASPRRIGIPHPALHGTGIATRVRKYSVKINFGDHMTAICTCPQENAVKCQKVGTKIWDAEWPYGKMLSPQLQKTMSHD